MLLARYPEVSTLEGRLVTLDLTLAASLASKGSTSRKSGSPGSQTGFSQPECQSSYPKCPRPGRSSSSSIPNSSSPSSRLDLAGLPTHTHKQLLYHPQNSYQLNRMRRNLWRMIGAT